MVIPTVRREMTSPWRCSTRWQSLQRPLLVGPASAGDSGSSFPWGPCPSSWAAVLPRHPQQAAGQPRWLCRKPERAARPPCAAPHASGEHNGGDNCCLCGWGFSALLVSQPSGFREAQLVSPHPRAGAKEAPWYFWRWSFLFCPSAAPPGGLRPHTLLLHPLSPAELRSGPGGASVIWKQRLDAQSCWGCERG